MYMTQENQRLLDWLNKQKRKDQTEIDISKKKYIEEIKNFKKENLIKIPKKLSLWQRIKILILGQ